MTGLLRFPSDIPMRHRWFTKASFEHPAKLHLGFLQYLVDYHTKPGDTIADPMAGIGSILLAATQQRNVIAREIEPKWLELLHENAAHIYREAGLLAGQVTVAQADARQPWGFQADHLIFSPPYACRASANETSRHYVSHKVYKLAKEQGISYTDRWHQFVNAPTIGASGAMTFHYGSHPSQIGHLRKEAYWQAMTEIYTNAHAAVRAGGAMVLIIKDHIRDRQRVTIADQTIALCESLGFRFETRHQRLVHPLSLWQRRRKEKGEPIVEEEDALVFRKVGTP